MFYKASRTNNISLHNRQKRMKTVVIEWVDSVRAFDWTLLEEVDEKSLDCISVGFLLKETDNCVTIAQNYGINPEQVCNIITIPKCSIKNIREIDPYFMTKCINKDKELTCKDIETILGIENNILHECNDNSQLVIEAYPKGEDYYGEILRRFNNQRIKPQRIISAEAKEAMYDKPANKVAPFDEFEGLTDFEKTLADICIGWIGMELGWKQYIKDNADVLLKIAFNLWNSVQDVPFEQKPADKIKPKFKVGDKIYLKPEYRMPNDDTPIANTVKEIKEIDNELYRFEGAYIFIEDQDKYELVKQKPWSEEDDYNLQCMIAKVASDIQKGNIGRNNELIDWLKSLKQRIAP